MEPDELITIRVQYLVDSDPFNSLSMYPIPSRAPVFSFASAVPLATQLGALLRHLGAPQRLAGPNPMVNGHVSEEHTKSDAKSAIGRLQCAASAPLVKVITLHA
uniref:FHOD1 N-terminal GTPase-binding domain-containing protein n=1 Tax=Anopheles epiroticus TaxID=199890 RepID=A0A182PSY2_9DIPT